MFLKFFSIFAALLLIVSATASDDLDKAIEFFSRIKPVSSAQPVLPANVDDRDAKLFAALFECLANPLDASKKACFRQLYTGRNFSYISPGFMLYLMTVKGGLEREDFAGVFDQLRRIDIYPIKNEPDEAKRWTSNPQIYYKDLVDSLFEYKAPPIFIALYYERSEVRDFVARYSPPASVVRGGFEYVWLPFPTDTLDYTRNHSKDSYNGHLAGLYVRADWIAWWNQGHPSNQWMPDLKVTAAIAPEEANKQYTKDSLRSIINFLLDPDVKPLLQGLPEDKNQPLSVLFNALLTDQSSAAAVINDQWLEQVLSCEPIYYKRSFCNLWELWDKATLSNAIPLMQVYQNARDPSNEQFVLDEDSYFKALQSYHLINAGNEVKNFGAERIVQMGSVRPNLRPLAIAALTRAEWSFPLKLTINLRAVSFEYKLVKMITVEKGTKKLALFVKNPELKVNADQQLRTVKTSLSTNTRFDVGSDLEQEPSNDNSKNKKFIKVFAVVILILTALLSVALLIYRQISNKHPPKKDDPAQRNHAI